MAPLVLSDRSLPYVSLTTHLGHDFNDTGDMDMDTSMRRGAFIGKCLEVQEAFAFAAPSEYLGAVRLYCGDLYGTVLARPDSAPATKLTNCWGVNRDGKRWPQRPRRMC